MSSGDKLARQQKEVAAPADVVAGPGDAARSRARASKELGERFAELLKEKHSHQMGVSARLGIPWRTHTSWMAKDAEPGSDLAEYQVAVLNGLDAQRRADLEDIESAVEEAPGTHASTIWNVRKHRHESRFKRFYDDPQKLEVSGPGGAPIEVAAVAAMSDSELRKRALADGDGDDE